MKLYTFRAVLLSIIISLFTVHSAMVYVIQVCRQLSSRSILEDVCTPRSGLYVHLVKTQMFIVNGDAAFANHRASKR